MYMFQTTIIFALSQFWEYISIIILYYWTRFNFHNIQWFNWERCHNYHLYQSPLANHWKLVFPPATSSGPPHWVWGMALMVGLPLFSLRIFCFSFAKKNKCHYKVFQNSIIFYIPVIRSKFKNIFWYIC